MRMKTGMLAVAFATALTNFAPTPVQASGLWGAYLAARQAEMSNDFEAAARHYGQAMLLDPDDAVISENALSAALALGDLDQAEAIASLMADATDVSQIANMVRVAARLRTGDLDPLVGQLSAGDVIGPLVDGLLHAWTVLGQGDTDGAIAAFDTVAKGNGFEGFANYHKALALGVAGEFDRVVEVLTKGAGGLEKTRRGAIALAQAYGQLDRFEAATATLDGVFGATPDQTILTLRARLAAGEPVPFDLVSSAKEGAAEVFFSVASALKGQTSDNYLILYSRVAEALNPANIDALLLSAELLENMEQFELAVQSYDRVPASHPAYLGASIGRANALRDAGKSEAAIEALEQLTTQFAAKPEVHSTLGNLYRQQEDFEQAKLAYDASLALRPEGDRNTWFVLYTRGITQERLGDWPAAEKDLRAALALRPEQPQILNYLGYSMVEQGINLTEALGMIETAVAARPDNGYIRDSLGWALYHLGRYPEAVQHMEAAVELVATDAEINDHLGDTYWAVGRFIEAHFQWSRALSLDPDVKGAERIRRKLEVGLDVVLDEEGAAPLRVADGSN